MQEYRYDEDEIYRRLCKIIAPDRISNNPAELYCSSRDASYIKTARPPFAVIRPSSSSEVSEILKVAHEMKVPVTPRGAATGLTGGAVPLHGGIVLDMTGMDQVIEGLFMQGSTRLYLSMGFSSHLILEAARCARSGA